MSEKKPGEKKSPSLTALCEVTEELGDQQVIHFSYGDAPLVVKTHLPFKARIGQPYAIELNLEKAALFNTATGENILREHTCL